MREKSIARHFVGTVKEILGTAYSVGCTVDGACVRLAVAQQLKPLSCDSDYVYFNDRTVT